MGAFFDLVAWSVDNGRMSDCNAGVEGGVYLVADFLRELLEEGALSLSAKLTNGGLSAFAAHLFPRGFVIRHGTSGRVFSRVVPNLSMVGDDHGVLKGPWEY